MEAMAAGVPVVATRLSGIPELVSADTGMLVEPNDSRALADAIERLLDDDELARRCVEGARARVVSRFDVFTEAQRLGDLFARSLSTA
jgi:glycosyltransferase involved in cell wall biosynthesis